MKVNDDAWLTFAEVVVRIGIPEMRRASLWKWVRAGRFPAPVRFSHKRSRWRAADVDAWLARHTEGGK